MQLIEFLLKVETKSYQYDCILLKLYHYRNKLVLTIFLYIMQYIQLENSILL